MFLSMSLIGLSVATAAPVYPALDFEPFTAERGPPIRFDVWVTIHARSGETLDNGRWRKFAGLFSRAELMEAIGDTLERSGCEVEEWGSHLVVKSYQKSPVSGIEVKTTGAGPIFEWVPAALKPKPKPKT